MAERRARSLDVRGAAVERGIGRSRSVSSERTLVDIEQPTPLVGQEVTPQVTPTEQRVARFRFFSARLQGPLYRGEFLGEEERNRQTGCLESRSYIQQYLIRMEEQLAAGYPSGGSSSSSNGVNRGS